MLLPCWRFARFVALQQMATLLSRELSTKIGELARVACARRTLDPGINPCGARDGVFDGLRAASDLQN